MKILCADIGTGTQDIFLYDSRLDLENGFKLVMPSPTMMVHRRLKLATKREQDVVLTGVTMGGGPSHWAVESHIQAGLEVFATPQAARSFNDDLEVIQEMGVKVIGEEEAAALPDEVARLEMRDFDFPAIASAFAQFGVSLDDLAAVAVAVFDHGAAPPDVSDRQFRFDYIVERIAANGNLSTFAFKAGDVPDVMTRMQAVVHSAKDVNAPLVVMDTAPAAIMGATLAPAVRERDRVLVTNVGNFHTLAFRLGPTGIEGVFEHHTGLLDRPKLDGLLLSLANGTLKHQDVFDDHGHGATIPHPEPLDIQKGKYGVVVTGPRQAMMRDSILRPYFAAPYGDMMLTGCFGLLTAVADVMPKIDKPIRASLQGGGGSGTPPWELTDGE
jgi:uncharacterized protein (DUF1786 family)